MTTVRATIVNHNEIEIARPAAIIWAWLLENIAEAGSYIGRGYLREPATDRAAIGGGRLRLEKNNVVDEIVYAVTERDEEATRLSVRAEFSSGWLAFATYQAIPTETGCICRIDCHTNVDVPAAPGASQEAVRKDVAAMRDSFDFGPALAMIKAELEGGGKPA